jgi:hypothetical protein
MVKLIKLFTLVISLDCLALTLDQEYNITDNFGVVIPNQLVYVSAGATVKIKRVDGFVYTGKITEIEEADGSFKVYGQVDNVEDTFFGFSIAKGGVFAGAIVERANNKTYVLEFSLEHKGYIFLRTLKYDKTFA